MSTEFLQQAPGAGARARSYALLIAGLAGLLGAGQGWGSDLPLWSIGKPDGYSIEFAPGARDSLTYEVGKHTPSKDFAGHHRGSMGFDGAMREQPYTILFDLNEPVTGPCHLALDLIYKSGAPARIEIRVNGHAGILPIRHEPKKSGDGEEANMMLLAQQHLTASLDGAWLQRGRNEVTIVPLGLGGLDYDAIALHRGPPATRESPRLEPGLFFSKRRGRLIEEAKLNVPFDRPIRRGTATVNVGRATVTSDLDSGKYDFGVLLQTVPLPADLAPSEARIRLDLDGTESQSSHPFTPGKKWKVFICPKVHNDVGYTDLQPHVNELDNRNTDTALDIMDRFPFYKFNFETAWLVDNYLDCRPPDYQQRFFRQLRTGRATLNALYLNLMTGLSTGEELYRAMYFTHRLHREHGGNFDFACLTDAPSHTWFLPTLLEDVGVRCFSNGANQTRAPILHFSSLNEHSPYWWEGPNRERILMWYARSYTQWKRLTGPDFISAAASGDYLRTSVPQFLTQFRRPDYAPDAVMVYGAYVDNAAIPPTGEAELIEQWNREFEYPKLIVASDAEYFSYIEKHYGSKIPVHRGDCGAYWEDGVASSALQTALNRQSQSALPAAELAHSFAGIFRPRERYPAEDFARAWDLVMFYNEHTWGAHNSVSQPDREFVTRQWEIKESYATRANLDARTLLARGLNRLAQNLAVDGDTVLAFNFQNRPRDAALEIELNRGQVLVDLATGKPAPVDRILEKDGWQRLRFVAQSVPPLGYKGYALRAGDTAPAGSTLSGETIESPHYRLTIDPQSGGIRSLFDKRESRELSDPAAPYHLNQYVYVTGGEGSLILNHAFGTPPAQLAIHRPMPARIVEIVRTPLGQRLTVVTSCSNAPMIRSEYRLYDAIPRVDIINTVEKQPTRSKEAVYFAFPFAARSPAFAYQIQNAWCRPNEDQMPGACREWFTPQNVVHVRDQDAEFDIAWATPDAPLVCLTDINRGRWLDHLPVNNAHVYSYVMHNYWFTNYRAEQGGSLRFQYSITSGRNLAPETLAAFDEDTRSPVLAYPFVSSFSARVGGAGNERPLPAAAGSLLSVDSSHVQVVTLKEAEDKAGWILRLRETAGRPGEAVIASSVFQIEEAQLCNGVEVTQRTLPVSANRVRVPVQPNRFITLRLKLATGRDRARRG